MASGSPIIRLATRPLRSSASYPTWLVGGATPADDQRVWTFPNSSTFYLDFLCALKNYTGGGLTIRTASSAAVASGSAVLQAAIRAFPDDAEDLDAAHSYDFNTVTIAAPSAINEVSYDSITFTDGADMDSLGDGQLFTLRFLRDPGHGSDNLNDTFYLWDWWGWET